MNVVVIGEVVVLCVVCVCVVFRLLLCSVRLVSMIIWFGCIFI